MSKERASQAAGEKTAAHLPYNPPAEKTAEWKKKFNDIFLVTVKDAFDNEHCAVFKKPGRKELSLAMSKAKDNPMAMNDSLFVNCWLEGDEIIKTDDSLYLAACGQLAEMIEVRQAEIKKL